MSSDSFVAVRMAALLLSQASKNRSLRGVECVIGCCVSLCRASEKSAKVQSANLRSAIKAASIDFSANSQHNPSSATRHSPELIRISQHPQITVASPTGADLLHRLPRSADSVFALKSAHSCSRVHVLRPLQRNVTQHAHQRSASWRVARSDAIRCCVADRIGARIECKVRIEAKHSWYFSIETSRFSRTTAEQQRVQQTKDCSDTSITRRHFSFSILRCHRCSITRHSASRHATHSQRKTVAVATIGTIAVAQNGKTPAR